MILYDASSCNYRNFIQRKYYITQFGVNHCVITVQKSLVARNKYLSNSKFYFIETFIL